VGRYQTLVKELIAKHFNGDHITKTSAVKR